MAELTQNKLRALTPKGAGTPILVLMILAMMTLPLPTIMLDLFFTFNITLALVVVLATVYTLRPLEFAAFPTVLLVTTLLRLALNVASTRVVLLNGHTGPGAAGSVIESFGAVVVGGNYAVGLVVFAILVIINFVVVTKGAGRISEVSARFTLDAMPGKQMAIDADLNAGLLTQEEARDRREEVSKEADFYGAMDGASKFVRGDAVAGLLILFINILGGVAIGMSQHGLDFGTAMQFYALLTIGDGLVAQIPSLLLSTSAAIMVTRQNSSNDMSTQVIGELFTKSKALWIAAAILGVMGIIPGMPHFAFLLLAIIAAGVAYNIDQKKKRIADEEAQQKIEEKQVPSSEPELKELSWDDVPPVDPIGLEVGYRLIPLVDQAQDGKLMGRVKGVRKKLSQELGFLIPPVHIRDNLELSPNAYRITLMGVAVGEAEVHPDREMAINPGQVFGEVQGIKTKDPAFGLDAVWIETNQKEQAQSMGYTVVDCSTVVATHLSQLVQSHASELLGHEEVEHLLKKLSKSAPKLVENLVPDSLPLGVVVKVLQNLLLEQVPIRDMRTIAETLAEYSVRSQDPAALTSAVRISLSRLIIQNINGLEGELPVITLDPNLEQILHQSLQASNDESVNIEPGLAEKLQRSLKEAAEKQEAAGKAAVLLTSPGLRTSLAHFARFGIPGLHVLSFQEIPDNKQIRVVATVGQ
ncbi:flagellar biosynthesis protein FlhA [Pleionea mediterranea]|uniref:Flagellar biosynthesis protein FlhA n=1 Tax=Pleionea mediterranea TaxID=523701 RepID=A0A316FKA2_9GAMM|nr:flagellar biosynthesis protein FlhA [Pleionea mediterranea]PWK49134.1 flagellar biosynthesis protein FlhA [Pleionea mediterranea]